MSISSPIATEEAWPAVHSTVRERGAWDGSVGLLNPVAFFAGLALLLVGVSFDWGLVLRLGRFPAEQFNEWVRVDLAVLRAVWILVATLLMGSGIVLWRYPHVVARVSHGIEAFTRVAVQAPFFIPLCLTALILLKTVWQLGLYVTGYTNFSADDFTRALSAAYWLRYHNFDLGTGGWPGFGLGGAGWLPFPDYLFSIGLALNRDLFLTPKIVNLCVSGIGVTAAYFLGREAFGRTLGLLTAALFAFQPWQVWLGISGMTSDLPGVVLIALFGAFLARWLRTNESRALLAAAGSLAAADGFRYENWFFSLVFSLLVVLMALKRWREGRPAGQLVPVTLCAMAIANAFPVLWMTASHFKLGVWLPELQAAAAYYHLSLPIASTTTSPMISMPALLLGSFPFEVALSIAGTAVYLTSGEHRALRPYLLLPVGALLLFALVFKGQLAAYLECGRYFLSFVVLMLPFVAFFVAQLMTLRQPWRNAGFAAACLILLAVATHDLGRGLNYPSTYPRDAVRAGWTMRGLQETGTIPNNGRVLIERTADWGDLSIVVMANRPERFVALQEFCGEDVGIDPCTESVRRAPFDLVVLSSPKRVASFQEAFRVRSWTMGRYYIFDMRSLEPAAYSEVINAR